MQTLAAIQATPEVNPQAIPFRLLHDQVLIQPISAAERFEAQSPAGLWLAQAGRDKKSEFCWIGRVVKCGPGDLLYKDANETYRYLNADQSRYEMSVKPGDIVLYERRPWAEVEFDGKTYVVLHDEQHVVAVLEG